ncbi:MAG: hypothetical protein AB7F89_01565 [Pirellulaceae bacterium]
MAEAAQRRGSYLVRTTWQVGVFGQRLFPAGQVDKLTGKFGAPYQYAEPAAEQHAG